MNVRELLKITLLPNGELWEMVDELVRELLKITLLPNIMSYIVALEKVRELLKITLLPNLKYSAIYISILTFIPIILNHYQL